MTRMPDQSSRLPAQLGCWLIFHSPTLQHLPAFAASFLNAHFCRSATVSTAKPAANISAPNLASSGTPAGRAATGTPAASVCGSETSQPHRKLATQKVAAPETVESMSPRRASCFVCSTR